MLPRLGLSARSRARHSGPRPSVDLPTPALDYRGIAENVVYKSHNAFNRKAPMPVGTVQTVERLYKDWKDLDEELNARRAQHNALIKRVKDPEERDRDSLIDDARGVKSAVQSLESRVKEVESQLHAHASFIPNDTHPDTPLGPEPSARVLSQHGPDPLPASPLRDHVEIGRQLKLIDLDAGALATGASWYYLVNEGALLEMALIQFAFAVATKHGFRPVLTPDVVKADVARRCGFAPRDDAQVQHMYHLENSDLVLTGTAEIPLAALFANRTLDAASLPQKVVGLGRAFRSEAGARGADTRGLYRVHQFSKVELFAATLPAQSDAMMEELRAVQVELFSQLGLPFRVLDMPSEELGASAYRKYDMEAWMPGRGKWGEISSTSNCTDYQSRRLHIRHSASAANEVRSTQRFAHTLNGTAAAIPRLIVALLENGVVHDEGGKISSLRLPAVLARYWGGCDENVPDWISWV
ncbi:seryl-tRNA synthetase [Exidia glandulosa HHB12029]|uniref:serine--tRNA ligase n=1 Tax=Exidia glandulosa HHB12029 TaxID=1314781 RepID=A0A165EV57_EXIGL|nr:seryl-tRNA synthetase [Exidia glandulosa HHB12029]